MKYVIKMKYRPEKNTTRIFMETRESWVMEDREKGVYVYAGRALKHYVKM